MATTATQIINIVTLNKSTLHWMVSRIVQDSINFYYFWDEYYINAYGITKEKANEQLEMYLSFNIYKNLYQDLRVKIDQSPIVFFEYLQEIATHIVRDIAFWETVTQICGATKIIINEKHNSYDNKRNQKLGMDQISRGPIYGILNPIFRNCNR